MQEFIEIYENHKAEIEKFLIETLHSNGQYLHPELDELENFYKVMPSLELIYVTDSSYTQVSENLMRNKRNLAAKGRNRRYLFEKMHQPDKMIYSGDPYISTATGESCITLMAKVEGHFIFFDFNLVKLLMRFGLLEHHAAFDMVTRGFYMLIGVSLMFFALMSIGYAFYDYVVELLSPPEYSLEDVFKPIIALTMGLAIFDLAKTLLEREVFFKPYADKKVDEQRLLSKFLTAIIIALSIEALMVVFKTALHDTSQMLYALYLIIGVSLIILSLAYYNKVSDARHLTQSCKKKDLES